MSLGPNFYPKLVSISSELGMKPEDILLVMVSESGINPAAYNSNGGATGLIQFMPETLKGLGYQGSSEDFAKINADKQLDYVKKYIQGQISMSGHPLKSAAEYYVANFYPVALKLPGIRQGDADTVFLEKYPKTVTDPKTGRKYSKKYYDIGIKIDPGSERAAYDANPLFHGKVPGAITYGDMMKQVDKNRQNPIYRQALQSMKNASGYQATEQSSSNVEAPNTKSKPYFDSDSLVSKIENLIKSLFAAREQNQFLISVGSSANLPETAEYARILSTALQEYLGAKTRLHTEHNNIEISCKAFGKKLELFNAIKELSNGVSDAFAQATQKSGSIKAFATILADSTSDYPLLHPKDADRYSRIFQLTNLMRKRK